MTCKFVNKRSVTGAVIKAKAATKLTKMAATVPRTLTPHHVPGPCQTRPPYQLRVEGGNVSLDAAGAGLKKKKVTSAQVG